MPLLRTIKLNSGFTLLEILVALAVVSIALIAVVKTAGNSAAGTAYLKEKTYAHWVAMNRLEELRLEKKWLRTGTDSDTVEMFGTEWQWFQTISKSPNELTENRMRVIEIAVILADGGDEEFPLVRLTGFLIHPELLAE